MLTISEAQRRAELFLTGQMLEALRAVDTNCRALIPSCTLRSRTEGRQTIEVSLPSPR
jgi:hypothetical protein